ncbi:SRPBCC family protein [Paraflavitalea pollutisoli]|uniref:SRPBCC family protein n=1 Tax=Paraflavitalea pollutisoli TaxID=3034143 RepID=UPI0023EB50B7|nr:SRPBCC domain-containing protein [Paraflavitalea sp. H1-2-19X]
MSTNKTAQFTKDLANKKMQVIKEFNAPVADVWAAWTKSELLDQWWAPKPWKAETKSMDFTEGGKWAYFMVGPEGERHGAVINYKKIESGKSFTGEDAFTDDNGQVNKEMPVMTWHVQFVSVADGTKVTIDITSPTEEGIETLLKMGFQEGFTMGLGNLDELLAKKAAKA